MKTASKVIFGIFVAITAISFLASLIMEEDEDKKNARKTALWSMLCGIIMTYVSWILWSL